MHGRHMMRSLASCSSKLTPEQQSGYLARTMVTQDLMILLVLLGVVPPAGADNGFKAVFAKHWQVAKEFTLAVAEAMPADSYDFKPNPEQLTFGRLMTHIGA